MVCKWPQAGGPRLCARWLPAQAKCVLLQQARDARRRLESEMQALEASLTKLQSRKSVVAPRRRAEAAALATAKSVLGPRQDTSPPSINTGSNR